MRARVAVAAVTVALAAAPLLSHRPAPVSSAGAREGHPHRARGAVHVHTGRSDDGGGDLDDVVRAARAAGLDFVVVTDHNVESWWEGRRRGVLVLGGTEKSTDAGHAVVLGTGPLPFRLDGDPATVVRDAFDLGGFVLVSHPTSSHPESRWTAGLGGVAGVEFLNLGEPGAWPRRGPTLVWPLLAYVADPSRALLRAYRPRREGLDLWDRALAERPVAGLLGSDAHGGIRAGPLWLPLPSHRVVFGFASQHLLLTGSLRGAPDADRALVLDALREGRGYAAFDALAAADGFLFEGRSGDRRVVMGESLPLAQDAELRAFADAPPGTTLVLLRDGREAARGERIVHRTDRPGVYRVEAYLDPRLVPGSRPIPWIVSNPIHVFPERELQERARRASRVPPLDPPLPSVVEVLDRFDGPALDPRWRLDCSRDARGSLSLDAGALRFDFALGERAPTHASACHWMPRDLSSVDSLVLRVRADRRIRFDVQVRVDDAGTRIWRRSVRADREWRTVAVPLAALTTYDRRGGRPALARVLGVYLHVDEATLPPGSAGILFVDDFGVGRPAGRTGIPLAPGAPATAFQ
jgi:hypothetical protein